MLMETSRPYGHLDLPGEWSHVAFVGTGLGNGSVQINFYLNGVKHPQSYTTSQTYGVAGNTQIGKYLDGSMFDFRMSSTPRYTADFTAPTDLLPVDADVTLSTLRYETLSDESTYGSSVSVVGDFGVEPVSQEDLPISTSSASATEATASPTNVIVGSMWSEGVGSGSVAIYDITTGSQTLKVTQPSLKFNLNMPTSVSSLRQTLLSLR